ncbi:MAG: dTDP-4-amino-4,6-dideoxygalactose transaminase [Lentisphaeria bacterium]|nr:dTDP-4-amino-4,6-dideoxygalactose transaminase [Lentisphaeria bacterium]NQZ70902.1 dTDP-4-amino-4,6-dideoxygalactose transaminase [Lentisphaeria bacterium]
MDLLPFNKPFIIGNELKYVQQAVELGHLSGNGPFTQKCHHWFEEHLKCQKALLTHSCTAALEMAAILCNLGIGDEVIMPSFTFVTTANAFVLRGATPVFIDIHPDTMNIDVNAIETAITEKTKAIVCVHYAGGACEMDKIMNIARKHNLFIIEDAAQALLSSYGSKKLGTIGDIGCLSFHETKNVISGEGGALLINNKSLIERAEILWEKGTNRRAFQQGEVDKYTWVDLGSSFLPSELVSAFLYAQLENADKIIEKRQSIFSKYYRDLCPLQEQGLIQLPKKQNNTTNAHIFYILTKTAEVRTSLITYLKEQNIIAVFHYVPLHSSPAGQRYGRSSGNLLVTNDVSERLLRLPLYFELSESQINRVVQALMSFYNFEKTGK